MYIEGGTISESYMLYNVMFVYAKMICPRTCNYTQPWDAVMYRYILVFYTFSRINCEGGGDSSILFVQIITYRYMYILFHLNIFVKQEEPSDKNPECFQW